MPKLTKEQEQIRDKDIKDFLSKTHHTGNKRVQIKLSKHPGNRVSFIRRRFKLGEIKTWEEVFGVCLYGYYTINNKWHNYAYRVLCDDGIIRSTITMR